MKKSAAAPARIPARTTPTNLWRNLALILGASTIALGIFLVRISRAVADITPAKVTTSTPAASLPRELTPYAAMGSFMAENNRIADLGWSQPQLNAFLDGMRSTYEGRGVPMNDEAVRLREQVSTRIQSLLASENPDPLVTYFRTLRETEAVTQTASGLHYRITEQGEGAPPRAEDTVVLSLTARLPDGASLPILNQARTKVAVRDLLPGLAEGVQLLSVGGKALVYVPPQLAFADRKPPEPIPAGAPIVFFVELHDILPPSAP